MNFLVYVKSASAIAPALLAGTGHAPAEARLEGVARAYPASAVAQGHWTLSQMLQHLVHEEIAAYRSREADRRLIRVLTGDQIAQGVAAGRVALGGREEAPPPVDEARAMEVACDFFKQGLFLVFADEAPVTELTSPVPVRDGLNVVFVALTLLIGS